MTRHTSVSHPKPGRTGCGIAWNAGRRPSQASGPLRRTAIANRSVHRQASIRSSPLPWALAAIFAFLGAVAAAENPSAAATPLRQLRFSPDGKYVFAQDDAEITVLTAHPLTILFRIPARDARDAQSTLDSRQTVFISSVSHLERYYVAEPSPGTVGLYERGKGLQATIALHKE